MDNKNMNGQMPEQQEGQPSQTGYIPNQPSNRPTSQPPIQPHSNKGLIIGLVIAIVIALAAVIYLLTAKPAASPSDGQVNNQNQVADSQDEMADWETYRNEEFVFEFKYPPNAVITVGNTDDDEIELIISTEDLKDDELSVRASRKVPDFCDRSFGPADNIESRDFDGISYLYMPPGSLGTSADYRYIVHRIIQNNLCYYVSLGKKVDTASLESGGSFKVFYGVASSLNFLGQDETADWEKYTNSALGFSLEYPQNYQVDVEHNDQYNRLASFLSSDGSHRFEVRLYADTDSDMGVLYGFLGSDVTSTNIQLGGENGFKAISETGYGDAGAIGQPYAVFAARYNGDIYHLVFYGDTQLSEEENQILSTFKFTGQEAQGETVGWEKYTSQEYNFQLQYPAGWRASHGFGDVVSVYGPEADLASIVISYYAGLNDLPTNPVTNKPYDSFEQYATASQAFSNQQQVDFDSGKAWSALLANDPSYKLLLVSGNGHFYEVSYKERYDQTYSELEEIVSTFKFINN